MTTVVETGAGAAVKTSGLVTSLDVPLGSSTAGDFNLIWLSVNTTGTGADPGSAAPTGWSLVGSSYKTGSPSHRLSCFIRQFTTGDVTTVTCAWTGSGNAAGQSIGYSGVDSTTPIPESSFTSQSASSTSWATGTITTAALRMIASSFGNRTSGTSNVWSALADTVRGSAYVSSAANIVVQDTNGQVAAGSYSKSATFSVATSVGNMGIVALAPSAAGTTYSGAGDMNSVSSLSGAVTVTEQLGAGMMSVSSSSGAIGIQGASSMNSVSSLIGAPTASYALAAAMTSVSNLTGSTRTPIANALLAGSKIYVAHRDGQSSVYGECTLEGYKKSVQQYSKAFLEIPVWMCSTGEYVCNHNQTTAANFGTNYTITSTPWGTLAPLTTLVGGNPIRRLTDVLDDPALANAYFVIDNKQDTNPATLIALMNAHAAGRWMGKQLYTAAGTWLTACQNAGVPVWAYFYPGQLSNMSSVAASLPTSKSIVIFGLGDFSTSPIPIQSDSDTFHSFVSANGLFSWAHILATSAQKTNADTQATSSGRAFDGYMMSGFAALAPTDSALAAAMMSQSSLSGSSVRTTQAASAMMSVSSFSGIASLSVPEIAAMLSASHLGSASSVFGAAAMNSVSNLTGNPSAGALPPLALHWTTSPSDQLEVNYITIPTLA